VDVLKRFQVEEAYDLKGGEVCTQHPVFSLEGKEVCKKYRTVDPKGFSLSKSIGKTPVQLYGQSIFPKAKRLLITEGELDAMSAYHMLSKYKVACVSLPQGATVKALADNLTYLKGFSEIVVNMDSDAPGQKVGKEIAALIPRAKFMRISEKDANDMLTAGKTTEFISSFFDAEVWKPESIVRVSDILKDVLKKPTMGEPWPWPSLTAATYGRNPGQGIYVGAGVKQGKSEWINELVAFDVKRGAKVAVLKYEENPVVTVKRISGKLDGIAYHRPGISYSDEDLERTAGRIDPYLFMYPAFGRADWESTKEYIRYCAVMGCKTVIIDPLTKLTNHLSSSDTETELRKISDELSFMAMDLGFFYIVTCHLKAPNAGPPHERGGKVQSSQFRGSRAMMECTFYMLGIERNRDPELSEAERNRSTFVLLEDRNFGNTCMFPVDFDPITQAYLEPVSRF
jgi:twinkle protein